MKKLINRNDLLFRNKIESIGKIKVLRLVLLVAIICWLIMIYSMSAKTGTQSAGLSKKVVDATVKIIPGYSSLPDNRRIHFYNTLHTVIRKTAHFTEYGILAILVQSFLLTFSQIKYRIFKGIHACLIYVSLLLFCAVCASLDEYHQSFVAGRGPAVRDVIIDTCGALFFMVIYAVIYTKIIHKKCEDCA